MAYFGQQHGWLNAQLINRNGLDETPKKGPIIVQEFDATVLIPPNYCVFRDSLDNLVIEMDIS
jgi:N-methylhydantoinase A